MIYQNPIDEGQKYCPQCSKRMVLKEQKELLDGYSKKTFTTYKCDCGCQVTEDISKPNTNLQYLTETNS